jgi:hypothetical protein
MHRHRRLSRTTGRPGRPRCFPRAEEGAAPAKPAPGHACGPGKIYGRPRASAARGRLRERTKRRSLTSREVRRPHCRRRQARTTARHTARWRCTHGGKRREGLGKQREERSRHSMRFTSQMVINHGYGQW